MASTNKTTNLGLNQWVLSDPFLMEDMNEDNRKIDAAIGGMVNVKLLDVTTSANVQQVDLDLSGIDLTKYASLQVLATTQVTPMGTATYLYAKINNSGGQVRSLDESTWYTQTHVGRNYVNNNDYYATNTKLDIFGLPAMLTKPYLTHIRTSGVTYFNGMQMQEFYGIKDFSANQSITSISFVTDSNGVLIKAGSRFEIYGVKK